MEYRFNSSAHKVQDYPTDYTYVSPPDPQPERTNMGNTSDPLQFVSDTNYNKRSSLIEHQEISDVIDSAVPSVEHVGLTDRVLQPGEYLMETTWNEFFTDWETGDTTIAMSCPSVSIQREEDRLLDKDVEPFTALTGDVIEPQNHCLQQADRRLETVGGQSCTLDVLEKGKLLDRESPRCTEPVLRCESGIHDNENRLHNGEFHEKMRMLPGKQIGETVPSLGHNRCHSESDDIDTFIAKCVFPPPPSFQNHSSIDVWSESVLSIPISLASADDASDKQQPYMQGTCLELYLPAPTEFRTFVEIESERNVSLNVGIADPNGIEGLENCKHNNITFAQGFRTTPTAKSSVLICSSKTMTGLSDTRGYDGDTEDARVSFRNAKEKMQQIEGISCLGDSTRFAHHVQESVTSFCHNAFNIADKLSNTLSYNESMGLTDSFLANDVDAPLEDQIVPPPPEFGSLSLNLSETTSSLPLPLCEPGLEQPQFPRRAVAEHFERLAASTSFCSVVATPSGRRVTSVAPRDDVIPQAHITPQPSIYDVSAVVTSRGSVRRPTQAPPAPPARNCVSESSAAFHSSASLPSSPLPARHPPPGESGRGLHMPPRGNPSACCAVRGVATGEICSSETAGTDEGKSALTEHFRASLGGMMRRNWSAALAPRPSPPRRASSVRQRASAASPDRARLSRDSYSEGNPNPLSRESYSDDYPIPGSNAVSQQNCAEKERKSEGIITVERSHSMTVGDRARMRSSGIDRASLISKQPSPICGAMWNRETSDLDQSPKKGESFQKNNHFSFPSRPISPLEDEAANDSTKCEVDKGAQPSSTFKFATPYGSVYKKPTAQIRPNALRSLAGTERLSSQHSQSVQCLASVDLVDENNETAETQMTAFNFRNFRDDAAALDRTSQFSFGTLRSTNTRNSAAPSATKSQLSAVSKFGTLRSRIKDYVSSTAAAGGKKSLPQQPVVLIGSCMTLQHTKEKNVRNRSTPLTTSISSSWEPAVCDYNLLRVTSPSETSPMTSPVTSAAELGAVSDEFSAYLSVAAPRPYGTSSPSKHSGVNLTNLRMSLAGEYLAGKERKSTFCTFLGTQGLLTSVGAEGMPGENGLHDHKVEISASQTDNVFQCRSFNEKVVNDSLHQPESTSPSVDIELHDSVYSCTQRTAFDKFSNAGSSAYQQKPDFYEEIRIRTVASGRIPIPSSGIERVQKQRAFYEKNSQTLDRKFRPTRSSSCQPEQKNERSKGVTKQSHVSTPRAVYTRPQISALSTFRTSGTLSLTPKAVAPPFGVSGSASFCGREGRDGGSSTLKAHRASLRNDALNGRSGSFFHISDAPFDRHSANASTFNIVESKLAKTALNRAKRISDATLLAGDHGMKTDASKCEASENAVFEFAELQVKEFQSALQNSLVDDGQNMQDTQQSSLVTCEQQLSALQQPHVTAEEPKLATETKPLVTTAQILATVSQPLGIKTQPLTTPPLAQPLVTPAQPLVTSAQALVTSTQPLVTPAQPQVTTPQLAPPSARRGELAQLTRRFVSDSQRLVSSATQSRTHLARSVHDSVRQLAHIVHACRTATLALGAASPHAIILCGRVRDLVGAWGATVQAARGAVGHALGSAEMKGLLKQATSLAAVLSSLIKLLNRYDVG